MNFEFLVSIFEFLVFGFYFDFDFDFF